MQEHWQPADSRVGNYKKQHRPRALSKLSTPSRNNQTDMSLLKPKTTDTSKYVDSVKFLFFDITNTVHKYLKSSSHLIGTYKLT